MGAARRDRIVAGVGRVARATAEPDDPGGLGDASSDRRGRRDGGTLTETRGGRACSAASAASTSTCRRCQRIEVVPIGFLRRLFGADRPEAPADQPVEVVSPPSLPIMPEPSIAVACPNCGGTLDPPPDHTRRCPHCRRPVVVRHFEGRSIYLTEAAVEVFEAERQHEIDEERWSRERISWLKLAQRVGAPADRRRRLMAAPISDAAVRASRDLYLVTAERSVRAARRDKRWAEVALIRRRQAGALFEEAGAQLPPSDEILALYREGAVATLREISQVTRTAELVGAACCQACRADNERVFRIADEIRTPRLPHAGCPSGLCTCDWWPALASDPKKPRRRRAPTSPPPADPGTKGPSTPGSR